jgi:hypothetical protein
VRLWATWDGAFPAHVTWQGTDTEDGLEATVTPRAVGPWVVHAGGAALTLDVQPARNTAGSAPGAHALPLYDVDADRCRDARYPTLSGPWVVGCSATGRVDRAYDLRTRTTIALSEGGEAPGVGGGAVWVPTRGAWQLPTPTADPAVLHFADEPVGPPATDGLHGAAAFADHVETFVLTDHLRVHTEAAPIPWYRTALAWPWSAWIEDGGASHEDVWMRTPEGTRRPLARTDRRERHVAGDDRWFAWVDDAGVYVEAPDTGERRFYPADTGFAGGLALWGPVACWEDRSALRAGTGDIDVRCSDGLSLSRPGNQMAPARLGPWLLFREDGRVMLATATELVLDDDDPRAAPGGHTIAGGWGGAHRDAPVSWTFDWPAPGWIVERYVDGAWVGGEAVDVGRVTLTSPVGDAVRLRPAAP